MGESLPMPNWPEHMKQRKKNFFDLLGAIMAEACLPCSQCLNPRCVASWPLFQNQDNDHLLVSPFYKVLLGYSIVALISSVMFSKHHCRTAISLVCSPLHIMAIKLLLLLICRWF